MTAEANTEAAPPPAEPVEAPVKSPAAAETDTRTAAEEEQTEVAVVAEMSSSFREESNFSSDLKESERKALLELRAKLEAAILENKLFKKDSAKEEPKPEPKEAGESEKPVSVEEAAICDENLPSGAPAVGAVVDEEVYLWGVPLLPSKGSETTDVVLLKFLRARDFKVKDAFEMLQNVVQWRKESKIDLIIEEDSLGADLGGACYMDGIDREGHPVCYNVSGVFQDDELYQKTFGTEEGREKFLRWRAQIMEKGIKKLDFKPGGVASLLQITDLKNMPGPAKKELRTAMKQVVQMLQDNYPEFVARNVFINVPFWYYAINAVVSPFLTQRTKSKFVFARSAKVAETLLRYIPAEAVPIKYGGLKRENDTVFSAEDGGVLELIVKASSTENIEIPVSEVGTTIVWDLTVLGWEVNYKEEFIPSDEGSYTIIIQKGKKIGAQAEPIRNSFRSNEPGKIVLTIENSTFWKKKVLYRYKTMSS